MKEDFDAGEDGKQVLMATSKAVGSQDTGYSENECYLNRRRISQSTTLHGISKLLSIARRIVASTLTSTLSILKSRACLFRKDATLVRSFARKDTRQWNYESHFWPHATIYGYSYLAPPP
jgi:hypothetical protein